MPGNALQVFAKDDVEECFQHLITVIPTVVRKVCARLGRYPDQIEVDIYAQEIAYLLWKNDYRVLCSFKRKACPETWLFTIVRRHILHQLGERNKLEALDDMPPEFFIVQQDQEKELLSREREEMLQEVVSNLTDHDQKLFGFLRQELSTEKIANEMGVKRRSASVMKRVLIVKLRRIIRERYSS